MRWSGQAIGAENAAALWDARKAHVFKPAAGHAGKAVYRGDKLTRKVWATIPDGGYVAQQRIAPSERVVRVAGERQRHKVDVRLYTYGGEMLLVSHSGLFRYQDRALVPWSSDGSAFARRGACRAGRPR